MKILKLEIVAKAYIQENKVVLQCTGICFHTKIDNPLRE